VPVTSTHGPLASPRAQDTRQARLRPEYAHRYPGIRVGEWQSAATLADRVLAWHLLRGGKDTAIWGRVLLEAHFEFRGGSVPGEERDGIRPRREDR
jgi:hypothetical protein